MVLTLRLRVHYLFRAFLLAVLSLYIIHLNDTDSLHYYLAPSMQKLLLLCPVPLLFIAFGMAWHSVTGNSDKICDCDHPLPLGFLKNVNVYGLFAVPLILGLLLPDQALGSDMAAKKGIIYSAPDPDIRDKLADVKLSSPIAENPTGVPPRASSPVQGTLNELFIAKDKYSTEFAELAKRLYLQPVIEVNSSIFSETIGAIDMYKQPFLHKNITLQGFVYREEDMKPDTFALSRFLMMCCPADAIPFGVLVQSDNASTFTKDTWVEIKGTIQATTIDGKETLQIKAGQIKTIEQPVSPYIFTNPDSVVEFDKLHANEKYNQ